MTDAPEAIWAMADIDGKWSDAACSSEQPQVNNVTAPFIFKYTRADIAAQRIEDLEAALSKARADALGEAANIANGYGSCACDPDMHAAILRLIAQPAATNNAADTQ
jgi:hypothetical protein